MNRYMIRRLALLMLSAILASSAVFFLLRILPGDAALTLSGLEASPEEIEATRRQLGTDKPVLVQYFHWIWNMAQGDFGISYLNKLPVASEIKRRLAVTLPLSLTAFVLSIVISFPLGIMAAVRRKSPVGIGVSVGSSIGIAIPVFWVGIILIWIFALVFPIFPAGGFPFDGWSEPWEAVKSLVLPVITISIFMSSILIRYVRSAILDVLGQDYLRTACSLGYSARAARWRHGIRNAAVPLVAILSFELSTSLLGAVVIENVFAIPGLGDMLLAGVINRDLPVVQDIVFIITLFVLIIGFLAELAQQIIDPRLRSVPSRSRGDADLMTEEKPLPETNPDPGRRKS
jgi:peptide/nickel transport system permease protein